MTGGPYIHPKQTAAERAAASAAMNKLRWQGTTASERSAFARSIATDPTKLRCRCGAMTLVRATTRAGKDGTCLGHLPGCDFYRQAPAGKRRRAPDSARLPSKNAK